MKARLLGGSVLDSRLIGQPHIPAAMEAGPRGITVGPVGGCPHYPVCTWFVFDSSGSVSSVYGNDVIARRFDEARYAIGAVARRCRCGHELVAIVHFDTPTSLDLQPTRLDRHGVRQAERCLAIPPDALGQSLLRPSLDAVTELSVALPQHEHVLVALTDFLLFDDNLPGLYHKLIGFPGTVHAVSLRATPPDELLGHERVVVTQITPDAAPGSVATAVLAGLTTHRIL